MRLGLACGLVCSALATANAQPTPAAPAEGPDGAERADRLEPPPPPLEAAPEPEPVSPAPAPVAAVPPPATTTAPSPPPQDPDPRSERERARLENTGFHFGSYGRITVGTDLDGGTPESANLVAHGPRIVEPSYLELDLWYGIYAPNGRLIRPVITLAFDGTLFHETGKFDAQPALRNMYLQAELTDRLEAWAGSRMYRGDNFYLIDRWPLDDLNTIGAGLQYRRRVNGPDTLEAAAHVGVNRLDHEFQFQEIDVPNPEHGATTVTQLNRQRMLLTGNVAYTYAPGGSRFHYKAKVHGEVHALPSGSRRIEDGTFEELPSDGGYLIGAQLVVFEPPKDGFRRHLNLVARYAKALAAFDELAPPTSFGRDLTTSNANELLFAAYGNWDARYGNMMFGLLSRRFIDADGSQDRDDGWEYALVARPLASIVKRQLFAGAELSYQARFPQGLNPTTQIAQDPSVFQFAPMLVYSPMGPSSYDRPQLRLVYRAARRNDAARELFVPNDPRRDDPWSHFLGIQAEWWFNSTTQR